MSRDLKIVLSTLFIWPVICTVWGAVIATINGNHGSIIFVLLGAALGVLGAMSQTIFHLLLKHSTHKSEFPWFKLAISILILSFTLLILIEGFNDDLTQTAMKNLKVVLMYAVLPVFTVSFFVGKIFDAQIKP